MHRLVVMYPRPEDPASFRRHYEDVHVVLGQRIPGVREMHYSFEVGGLPGPDAPGGRDLDLFCVFMADFDDEAALFTALASPEGEAVLDDVQNYATGGFHVFHYELPN